VGLGAIAAGLVLLEVTREGSKWDVR